MFSRNASSSRAIPVERLIQDILDDPAMPVFWGKNRPGMQAIEEMDDAERAAAIADHLADRDHAVASARRRSARGEHKQTVNRILEPWSHINVICTATDWSNFYSLRCHPAAQPEMRVLAECMKQTVDVSVPKPLAETQWHLPYVSYDEDGIDNDLVAIRCSVARCARVSYLTHEGKPPNVADDLKLYDRLVGSVPLHASPAEHQATPDQLRWIPNPNGITRDMVPVYAQPEKHGNLHGWIQFRKTLPNENVADR